MRLLKVIPRVLLTLACNTALAQMSIPCSDPLTPEIHYGSNVTYSLLGSPVGGGSIIDVQWQYEMTSPCVGPWSPVTDTGQNGYINYSEGTVGTFTVQAKVTVMQWPKQVVQTVTGNFTVLPPDDIDLPLPPANSVTVPIGAPATFGFPVKCRGNRVGYLTGTPLANWTHIVYFGNIRKRDQVLISGPWLTINGNAIQEMKFVVPGAYAGRFAAANVGDPVYSYQEQFFIKMPNTTCGIAPVFSLQTVFAVIATKAGPNSVTITVSPP